MGRATGMVTAVGVSTGTAAKTVLQVHAATGRSIRLKNCSIGFHGVTATDEPIRVELLRQSTAGTMTAATPVKGDEASDALSATAASNATVEPTAGEVLACWAVHPQSGIDIPFPEGEIVVPGGGYLGLRVTATVGVASDAAMRWEE